MTVAFPNALVKARVPLKLGHHWLLRRELGIELAKPENAGHPLAETDIPIEEKAFQLRDYCENEDPLARSIFAIRLIYWDGQWVIRLLN